ncbi:MAG: FAD-dependent oxidoreductase [Oscillospiraceae bacterium]|nr:FAD-dependent oxidoreductase [Oscillospiraceae bacterium]
MIKSLSDLTSRKDAYAAKLGAYKYVALVCTGSGCAAAGKAVCDALKDELNKRGLTDSVAVLESGCLGTCTAGTEVFVLPDETYYTKMDADKIRKVAEQHLAGGAPVEEYTLYDAIERKNVPSIKENSFFKDQVRVALRNCGMIDATDIDAYIAKDGYAALANVLAQGDKAAVANAAAKAALRDRCCDGAATADKLAAGKNSVCCNADEGVPSAFIGRTILEGDPHTVIEGLLLAGYSVGASKGCIYIPAAWTVTAERVNAAIQAAKNEGLLGDDILGSGFSFDISVCDTADCGADVVFNAETLSDLTAILLCGPEAFTAIGTEKSAGTKVFALGGKINNPGLVELPMGHSLAETVFGIGGGIPNGKKFKAAQTGGHNSACLTSSKISMNLDFESFADAGYSMGSGMLSVIDSDGCMVNAAYRFCKHFLADAGVKELYDILEKLVKGNAAAGDVEALEAKANALKESGDKTAQAAASMVLSTLKKYRGEYEEHVIDKFCACGSCYNLVLAPCQNACPAEIDIPAYMGLIAEKKYAEAYRVMQRDNPLSACCGRVCVHPCETVCRRNKVDEGVRICELKRFATDFAYADGLPTDEELKPIRELDKKVGIIGAGPSGLVCGYYLARLGYKVDIYESEKVAGGLMYFGIPAYRLPKDIVAREVKNIERAGVNIILNTKVGKDIPFDEFQKKYDAIYVAVGTGLAVKMGIEGDDLDGVIYAVDYLHEVALGNGADVKGKKVAIVGGGNSAVDAARTALREGASEVHMLYRRDRASMPADECEVDDAVAEGVVLRTLLTPVRFVGENGKLTGAEIVKQEQYSFDASGRRKVRAIKGSNFVEEYDFIIPAVSQKPEAEFARDAGVKFDKWDCIQANMFTMETNVAGIYTGGDAARGPDVVITAIRDGKRAAASIDKYLGGEGVLYKGPEVDIGECKVDGKVQKHGRFPVDHIDPMEARKDNTEVSLGMTEDNGCAEAARCLRCDRNKRK